VFFKPNHLFFNPTTATIQMKCSNCHKVLTKIAYYKAKPLCPRCFERIKYKDTHCSIEEFRELARQRGRRRTKMIEERKKEELIKILKYHN